MIIEGQETLGCYHFYAPFKGGVWRNNGVGFNDDEILIVEPTAELCETSHIGDGWHGIFLPKHMVAIEAETRSNRARYSYIHRQKPTGARPI
jgi:hypothetical protein